MYDPLPVIGGSYAESVTVAWDDAKIDTGIMTNFYHKIVLWNVGRKLKQGRGEVGVNLTKKNML